MITEEQLKIKVNEKIDKFNEWSRLKRLSNKAINNGVCPACGEDLEYKRYFLTGTKAICKSCGFEHSYPAL